MSDSIKGTGFRQPIQPEDSTPKKPKQNKAEQQYYISPDLLKKNVSPEEREKAPKKSSPQQVSKKPAGAAEVVGEAATSTLQPSKTKKRRADSPETPETQTKRLKSKAEEPVMPGGMVNNGRNICYGNSLINALRTSTWFKEQLSDFKPNILTEMTLDEIKSKLPAKYANEIEAQGKLAVDNFITLPSGVRQKLLDDLSPDAKEELVSVLKEQFVTNLEAIITTIDEGGKVSIKQIDTIRALVRDLGWKTFDHVKQQQDSQEFLNFIFDDLLSLKKSEWTVLANYDLEVDVFALRPRQNRGHFIPIGITGKQNDINQLLNGSSSKEPFEPVDHLFNHIVAKHLNPRTPADFETISRELEKLLNDLLKLEANQSDATLQLLLNTNIQNITPAVWETIKNAAKYNYYEKKLMGQIEGFAQAQDFSQKTRNTRADELNKFNDKCKEILDSDAYNAFADILEADKQIKSLQSIENITNISRKQVVKDIDDKIADLNSKSISALEQLHKNLSGMNKLDEEDDEILTCLNKNKGRRKFDIQKIQDDLEKIKEKYEASGKLAQLNQPGSAYSQLESDLQNLAKIEEYRNDENKLKSYFNKLNGLKDKPAEFKRHCEEFKELAISDESLKAKYEGIVQKLAIDIDGYSEVENMFSKLAHELELLRAKHKAFELDVSLQYTMDAANPPQLLPIALNRYTGKFVEGNVEYENHDDSITPSPTVEVKLSGDNNEFAQYNLKAVIVHEGRNPASGHYYTYTPQADGKWMEHNDETVRIVDPMNNEFHCDSTIKKRSYIYLYEYAGNIRK